MVNMQTLQILNQVTKFPVLKTTYTCEIISPWFLYNSGRGSVSALWLFITEIQNDRPDECLPKTTNH